MDDDDAECGALGEAVVFLRIFDEDEAIGIEIELAVEPRLPDGPYILALLPGLASIE